MSKQKKSGKSSRQKIEAGLESAAGSLFGTDGFAKTAGLATNVSARVQRGVADRMNRNLGLMNMPSRDDITAIGERLIAMENRLLHIEDMLSRLVPDNPADRPASPPRTRKPAKAAAPAETKADPKPALKPAKKTKSKKSGKSGKATKKKTSAKGKTAPKS
jgi:hypothetical protein